MTTNMQQGTLLDVLKKKMRQTKEEMEKYKDEGEEYQKRLQGEVIRREEVSFIFFIVASSYFPTTTRTRKKINIFPPSAPNREKKNILSTQSDINLIIKLCWM